MKKKDSSKDQLRLILQETIRLRVVFFVLALVVIYGFIIWRVNTLRQIQPSASSIAAQEKSLNRPHIDSATVDKIKQLRDNSVSVRALFNQARRNPFQE